jgi:hypothetical protein
MHFLFQKLFAASATIGIATIGTIGFAEPALSQLYG